MNRYLKEQSFESLEIDIGGQFHGPQRDSIFRVIVVCGNNAVVLGRRRLDHLLRQVVASAGLFAELGERIVGFPSTEYEGPRRRRRRR